MDIEISQRHNQEIFMLWSRKTCVMGYADAGLVSDIDSWKLIFGYSTTFAGGAVSW